MTELWLVELYKLKTCVFGKQALKFDQVLYEVLTYETYCYLHLFGIILKKISYTIHTCLNHSNVFYFVDARSIRVIIGFKNETRNQ